MKNNTKMMIGIMIVVGAIAYLMFSGFSGATSRQVDLEKLLAAPENYQEKFIMTEGYVVGNSVNWDAPNVKLTFTITGMKDTSKTMDIVWNNVLPDNFQEATQVMVSGKFIPGEPFVAETLQTKCPSKYEEAEQNEKNLNKK